LDIFRDVVDGSPFEPYIQTALKEDIITSERAIFEPKRNTSRSEAFAMIMASVCLNSDKTDPDNWQKHVYDAAYTHGLTTQSWWNFMANTAITSQELHVLTARAADWAEETGGCNPKPLECN
jgi:hypothetical protein